MIKGEVRIRYNEQETDKYYGKNPVFRGDGTLVLPTVNSAGKPFIKGVHDNSEIKQWVAKELGIDMDDVASFKSFMLHLPTQEDKVFDLSNPKEYVQAQMAMNHPAVSSPDKPVPNAAFVANDKGRKVKESATKARVLQQALTFIEQSGVEELQDTLYALGHMVNTNDRDSLVSELFEVAQSEPQTIVALRKDEDRFNCKVLFHRAQQAGFIIVDRGTYQFQGSILGSSPEHSIQALMHPDNAEVYQRILILLEEKVGRTFKHLEKRSLVEEVEDKPKAKGRPRTKS